MKKRNVISILLYLIGSVLFIISNLSVTSHSLIDLEYYQRIILCSVAVGSIAIAPFVYKTQNVVGTIIKFVVAVVLIYCIFAFKGFEDNRIVSALSLL